MPLQHRRILRYLGELATTRQLVHELQAAQQQINDLIEENARLRTALTQTEARANELEDRISEVLTSRTERRGSMGVTDSVAHTKIAQSLRTLAEQDLYHIARLNTKDMWSSPAIIAHLISQMCAALFTAGNAPSTRLAQILRDGTTVPPEHIDKALRRGQQLRNQAIAVSRDHTWDFSFRTNAKLDPSRQQAWAACDPEQPVQFVVAPAYLAQGQIFCLQQVYTGPS